MVAQAAGDSVRVSVCGELAADPMATAILIGLGVDELSMAPPAIPAAKEAVRSTSLAGARDLARRALEQATAADVRALITASVGDEQGRQSS
jgi:phosphocarrier protein FPr